VLQLRRDRPLFSRVPEGHFDWREDLLQVPTTRTHPVRVPQCSVGRLGLFGSFRWHDSRTPTNSTHQRDDRIREDARAARSNSDVTKGRGGYGADILLYCGSARHPQGMGHNRVGKGTKLMVIRIPGTGSTSNSGCFVKINGNHFMVAAKGEGFPPPAKSLCI
jgi:hypothetical protein